MDFSFIKIEHRESITTISLNRAEKHNAFHTQLMRELITASEQLKDNIECRSVIFKAEGTHFSVGADIKALEDGPSMESILKTQREAELGGHLLRAIRDIPQPTVCAIQGVATGAGACVASACDFRIAADNAVIGYSEVRMGMNLMWQAIPYVVELVGPSRAKQLVMSGNLMPAEKLLDWGFVDEVCSENELNSRADAWANEYIELPPIAVQMIKRSINRYSQALGESIMHMDSDQWLLTTQTKDFKECLNAFKEKRKPDLKGT